MTISNETATVQIILGTRASQAATFDLPAIFCDAPYSGARTYELSSEGLAAMVVDGFSLLDRGYILASAMASQSPHAENVLIHERAALTTSVVEWTPLVTTEGAVYTFDLTYVGITSTITYTVPVSATVNTICDAVEILIDASAAGIAGAAVAPDNATATKLVFTGATAGEPVILTGVNPLMMKLLDVSTNAGIATDLADAALDYSFYGFVIDSYSEAENNAAAAWAEANSKIFFAGSADSTNIVDSAGSGVAQDFVTAGYNRSTVAMNGVGMSNVHAAALARQIAMAPGTSSSAYKTLVGPAAGALRASHITNAKGKNVLLYAYNGGTAETFFGKMASGRAIRIQHALDLLDARIREAIHGVFLSNEFVPMSDDGFGLMEGAVRGVLSAFLNQGIILPGFTVTVPKVATISDADKLVGKLSNLRFACVMPNDMLKVEVKGVVSF